MDGFNRFIYSYIQIYLINKTLPLIGSQKIIIIIDKYELPNINFSKRNYSKLETSYFINGFIKWQKMSSI